MECPNIALDAVCAGGDTLCKRPSYISLDAEGVSVRVAQWTRRLPTEQEIPGSSPGADVSFHSVVVSTRDFESRDPGSSPGGRVSPTFLIDSRVNKKTFPVRR